MEEKEQIKFYIYACLASWSIQVFIKWEREDEEARRSTQIFEYKNLIPNLFCVFLGFVLECTEIYQYWKHSTCHLICFNFSIHQFLSMLVLIILWILIKKVFLKLCCLSSPVNIALTFFQKPQHYLRVNASFCAEKA